MILEAFRDPEPIALKADPALILAAAPILEAAAPATGRAALAAVIPAAATPEVK